MIDRLTGGDITKDDEVYERNYREVLYRLSYWAVKDKYLKSIEMGKKKHK